MGFADDGGGFCLACEDFGRMFDHSFPACSLLFYFKVEISSCTLILFFMPGSVHSGSVSWNDCGQTFPARQIVYNIYPVCRLDARSYQPSVFGEWGESWHPLSRLDLAEACEMLVTHGADMNSRDRYGETPLLASVYFGCEMNARTLIQHGAALDLVDDKWVWCWSFFFFLLVVWGCLVLFIEGWLVMCVCLCVCVFIYMYVLCVCVCLCVFRNFHVCVCMHCVCVCVCVCARTFQITCNIWQCKWEIENRNERQ